MTHVDWLVERFGPDAPARIVDRIGVHPEQRVSFERHLETYAVRGVGNLNDMETLFRRMLADHPELRQHPVEVNLAAVGSVQPTYRIYNMDCIQGMAEHLPDNSVHHCVTSIPFEALFSYSHKTEDMGNNPSTVDIRAGQFGLNMKFFVEQLYRVMEPGAVVSIHVQQLLAYKNLHGYMGRRDFKEAVIYLMTTRLGPDGQPRPDWFEWSGEFVIPKDPQMAAHRHQLHSLQFTTGHSRDSRMWAPFVNDYVLLFRKPGDGGTPVRCLYDAFKNPSGWVTREDWIRWASGVWDDIHEIDVLDGWMSARETDKEKHVCPLQLEVIRRSIMLYSNPGATILDPFMGIGSTAYMALGGVSRITQKSVGPPRHAVGFELKHSYAEQAEDNCKKARLSRLTQANGAPVHIVNGVTYQQSSLMLA